MKERMCISTSKWKGSLMTKYVVLEIIDRDTEYLVYETFEEAVEALREAYEEICSERTIYNSYIDEDGVYAWANGTFLYDWQIISV